MDNVIPRISVCIPVFNGAAFLGECLESVLPTLPPDCELLVADNASTDSTWEVASARQTSRLKLFHFDQHLDLAANWERARRLASGRYVLMLSADDLLNPEHLPVLADALDQDGSLAAVAGGAGSIGDASYTRGLGAAYTHTGPQTIFRLEEDILAKGLRYNINACIFRRSVAEFIFRAEAHWACDLDLFLRLGRAGHPITVSPAVVTRYRQHEGALSAQRERMFASTLRAYLANAEGNPLRAAYSRRILKTAIWLFAYLAHRGESSKFSEYLRLIRPALVPVDRLIAGVASQSPWLLCRLYAFRAKRESQT